MKFKSQIVTAVSGSIGGTTFAHNQGGMYMRGRSIPTNPQSSFQTAVRNAVSLLSSAWGGALDEDQRAAWATYAANVPVTDVFGDARNLSGQQMFVRCNVPRLQAGLDRVDDGPTTFNLGEVDATVNDAAAIAQAVNVGWDEEAAWVDEAGSALLVYVSRPQSAGVSFFKGPYRFAGAIEGDDTTPPTSPENVDCPFPISVGDAVFSYLRLSRADGRLSSPLRFRDVVES